jgi:putative phosphoribosyl transferase
MSRETANKEVTIPLGRIALKGDLNMPPEARGLVIFAHGSGSSRHSPRNRDVAGHLFGGGLATLLFDLLTWDEEQIDQFAAHLRFDITLLAQRLVETTRWVKQLDIPRLPVGYFGASTGAAAALVAAAELRDRVSAVVSRGGRPDLAGESLQHVMAPTLLIVGARDTPVIPLNERALETLRCEKSLELVPGASHLFEESGTLEEAADIALGWFHRHLHF